MGSYLLETDQLYKEKFTSNIILSNTPFVISIQRGPAITLFKHSSMLMSIMVT